jgi:IS5 family transposase
LLPAYAQAVLADKGYYSQRRKKELRARGIFCGILDKAARAKISLNHKRIVRQFPLSI